MAVSLKDLQDIIRSVLGPEPQPGAYRNPTFIIKGRPVKFVMSANGNQPDAFVVDCRDYNAVSVAIYPTGVSPTCNVAIQGSDAIGGIYQTLPDSNAAARALTTSTVLFDVVVGTPFVKVIITSISGTFATGQGYVFSITPYVAAGQTTVNNTISASQNLAQYVGTTVSPTNPVDIRQVGLTPVAGTYTTTGTGAAIGTQASREMLVVARVTNTTDVLLGDGTAQTDRLTPGASRVIPTTNANLIFAKAVSGSPVLDWWAA